MKEHLILQIGARRFQSWDEIGGILIEANYCSCEPSQGSTKTLDREKSKSFRMASPDADRHPGQRTMGDDGTQGEKQVSWTRIDKLWEDLCHRPFYTHTLGFKPSILASTLDGQRTAFGCGKQFDVIHFKSKFFLQTNVLITSDICCT